MKAKTAFSPYLNRIRWIQNIAISMKAAISNLLCQSLFQTAMHCLQGKLLTSTLSQGQSKSKFCFYGSRRDLEDHYCAAIFELISDLMAIAETQYMAFTYRSFIFADCPQVHTYYMADVGISLRQHFISPLNWSHVFLFGVKSGKFGQQINLDSDMVSFICQVFGIYESYLYWYVRKLRTGYNYSAVTLPDLCQEI